MSVSNSEIKTNWPITSQVWNWSNADANIVVKVAKIACSILATPFTATYDLIGRVFSFLFASTDEMKTKIDLPDEKVEEDPIEESHNKASCSPACKYAVACTAAVTIITGVAIAAIQLGIITIL